MPQGTHGKEHRARKGAGWKNRSTTRTTGNGKKNKPGRRVHVNEYQNAPRGPKPKFDPDNPGTVC